MSKIIMSRSLGLLGPSSNAKNPGFRTAHTYMQWKPGNSSLNTKVKGKRYTPGETYMCLNGSKVTVLWGLITHLPLAKGHDLQSTLHPCPRLRVLKIYNAFEICMIHSHPQGSDIVHAHVYATSHFVALQLFKFMILQRRLSMRKERELFFRGSNQNSLWYLIEEENFGIFSSLVEVKYTEKY